LQVCVPAAQMPSKPVLQDRVEPGEQTGTVVVVLVVVVVVVVELLIIVVVAVAVEAVVVCVLLLDEDDVELLDDTVVLDVLVVVPDFPSAAIRAPEAFSLRIGPLRVGYSGSACPTSALSMMICLT
jgi:hypothetical protein